MMAGKKSKCCVTVLIVFGVGLLISGIVVAVLGSFTSLVNNEIKKNVPLKEDSTSFENWEKPEGDFFIKYYLFNITNTGNATTLPELKEFGPYTYRRNSTTNLRERKGQTLTYDPITEYQFDQSRSCSGCDPMKDRFTTVNYPLLTVLRAVGFKLSGLAMLNTTQATLEANRAVSALNNHGIGLFQERTVHEFLWGYEDIRFSQLASSLTRSTIPSFYAVQFNNSGSGLTKIHTGESDVDRVAEYLEWRNFKTLPWWDSDSANMINGTGGTRFKPLIEKDDELYVLVTEICRSLKITYDSTITVHGIDLYRFTPPKEVFNNGEVDPDNKGFCVTGPQNVCIPSGLLDVSACKNTAGPTFVASTPHFFNGEPMLSQAFKLAPTKEKDATFVDIEPNTGLTMQGHRRLQLNFALPRSLNIKNILLNVNSSDLIFIPTFYNDEFARISEEDADDFKKNVLLPLRVAKLMPYVMIGLGGLLLVIAVIIAISRRSNTRKTNDELGKENYSM